MITSQTKDKQWRKRGPLVSALGMHAVAPGSNPVLTSDQDLFAVVPDSTLPRFASNQLVALLPVGVLNYVFVKFKLFLSQRIRLIAKCTFTINKAFWIYLHLRFICAVVYSAIFSAGSITVSSKLSTCKTRFIVTHNISNLGVLF